AAAPTPSPTSTRPATATPSPEPPSGPPWSSGPHRSRCWGPPQRAFRTPRPPTPTHAHAAHARTTPAVGRNLERAPARPTTPALSSGPPQPIARRTRGTADADDGGGVDHDVVAGLAETGGQHDGQVGPGGAAVGGGAPERAKVVLCGGDRLAGQSV